MASKSFWCNGRYYVINYITKQEEKAFCLFLLIFIPIVWVCSSFIMPDESDYHTSSLCDEAKETVVTSISDKEKQYWKQFERKSSSEASYGVLDINIALGIPPTDPNHNKKTINYLGNGKYEIIDGYSVKVSQDRTVSGKTTKENIGEKFVVYRACVETKPRRTWYGVVDMQWKVLSYNILYQKDPEKTFVVSP